MADMFAELSLFRQVTLPKAQKIIKVNYIIVLQSHCNTYLLFLIINLASLTFSSELY